LARNDNTPQKALLQLAADNDPTVRIELADNPSISEKAVELLLSTGISSRWIRLGLSENPGTSAPVLEQLSRDFDPPVLHGVAANANTSAKTLDRLSQSTDWGLRYHVAGHKNTSKATLLRLAEDQDKQVAAKALNRLTVRQTEGNSRPRNAPDLCP